MVPVGANGEPVWDAEDAALATSAARAVSAATEERHELRRVRVMSVVAVPVMVSFTPLCEAWFRVPVGVLGRAPRARPRARRAPPGRQKGLPGGGAGCRRP